MDENLQNIEDLFKGALEDNEEMPEPKVWEGIEHILDRDNVIKITKKYENLKKVAFLLLFLLAGLTIYELDKSETANGVIKRNKVSFDKATVSADKSNNNIALKNLTDTQDADLSRGNAAKDNLTVGRNTASNHLKMQTTHTRSRKRKKDLKDNQTTIAADITGIKLQQKSKYKPFYKSMKKHQRASEDEQRLTDNLKRQSSNQTTLSRPFDSLPVERINKPATGFADSNRLSKSLSVNKIIPIADTKNASAKKVKTKDIKLSRFSVNAFFSPDMADYRLQDNNTGNQHDNAVETEKSERHEFSSTSGAMITYNLKRNWSIQSGLTYSNINITVVPKTIYAQTDNMGSVKYRFNTSSGYAYLLPSFSSNPNIGDSLYTATSTHTLIYIGIPVAAKYSIEKGKLIFNVRTGVSANFLIKGRIETEVERGPDIETEVIDNLQGLKKVYLSGFTSAGVDYMLNKKMALTFEPTWRFALNAINKDVPVKSYPRSFGLGVGVNFKL